MRPEDEDHRGPLVRDFAGQGLAEYIVVTALVAIAVLLSVRLFGKSVGCEFSDAEREIRTTGAQSSDCVTANQEAAAPAGPAAPEPPPLIPPAPPILPAAPPVAPQNGAAEPSQIATPAQTKECYFNFHVPPLKCVWQAACHPAPYDGGALDPGKVDASISCSRECPSTTTIDSCDEFTTQAECEAGVRPCYFLKGDISSDTCKGCQ